jgi:hypothetical protein
VDGVAERAAITVMDPGRTDYQQHVWTSAATGGVGGIFLSFALLVGGGNSSTVTTTITPDPVPNAGMWVCIVMGVCTVGGGLVGLALFRPFRYTLEDDRLTRGQFLPASTSVEGITKVGWSTGILKGVEITSSSLMCTLTVREETRPLLFALGEALTRLNLLHKVQGGADEADLRLALGLNDEIAGRSLFTTENPRGRTEDSNPGVRSPQDRPAHPPEAPRDEPGRQDGLGRVSQIER